MRFAASSFLSLIPQVSRLRDLPIFLCYLATLIHTYHLAQVRPKSQRHQSGRVSAAGTSSSQENEAGPPTSQGREGSQILSAAWSALLKGYAHVVHVYRCKKS